MGQKVGKVELLEIAKPFTALPKRSMLTIWQAFNDVADGFGLNLDDLQEILSDLKDELNISKTAIDLKSEALFSAMDSDKNGLIDALECISTIAVLSGMKFLEIMQFILKMYDFDGSQVLSLDEVVLALKSVTAGCCKLQLSYEDSDERNKLQIAKEEMIEQLVSVIFQTHLLEGQSIESIRLNIQMLSQALTSHPDVTYWFHYFGQRHPSSMDLQTYEEQFEEIDFEKENLILQMKPNEQSGIEWDVRLETDYGEIDSLINPWISTVAMLTPIQYSNLSTLSITIPYNQVRPDWIYGYNSEKSKSNIFYNHLGDVTYPVSKYAIVYNFQQNKQSIFTGHNYEILCLSIHPNKQIIVTGDAGPQPRVLVWHSGTLRVLYGNDPNTATHRNGIIHAEFSLDGKLIVSIGNESITHHTICITSWMENITLFTANITNGPCFSATFSSNHTLVVGGKSFIYFFNQVETKGRIGYTRRNGYFSSKSAVHNVTALCNVFESESKVVGGTAVGQLLIFIDINCVRNVKAHVGSVNTLQSGSFGILSGGKDYRIRTWTLNLEPTVSFDLSFFGINPSIRSICLATDGTTILVGTRGGNIYEISALDGSDTRGEPITMGHYNGQINAIVTHPKKSEFITVGQDQTLRIYDSNLKTQLKIASFDADVRTAVYSPDGEHVVVGFGNSKNKDNHVIHSDNSKKCGAFVVLLASDLKIFHEAKDTSAPISVVKYSAEGETLAIGTEDGSIFLYGVHEEYELIGKCVRHTTRIIGIDFSLDGEWLRSNSIAKELFFFNADDAEFQANTAAMRDVVWATNSCLYTWHTKSIHRTPFKDEIVTCVQTPNDMDKRTLAVVGTSLGYVKIHSYPCAIDTAEHLRYPSHCGPVAGVGFLMSDEQFITVGTTDQCIIQWSTEPYLKDSSETLTIIEPPKNEDFLMESRNVVKLSEDFLPKEAKVQIGKINDIVSSAADEKQVAGDQLKIKSLSSPENDPWLSEIVEPTLPPPTHVHQVPEMSIVLEHVYGYEAETMRNSVRYVADFTGGASHIVHTSSAIGIVTNTKNKSQKLYQGHSDSITALASSSNGNYIATGQLGITPSVMIWNPETCRTLHVVKEPFLNSIISVTFSSEHNDHELIAVLTLDPCHTVMVYNWKQGVTIMKAYCGLQRPVGLFFHHDDLGLVTYGINDVKIWSQVQSRFPTYTRPTFNDTGPLQTFLCGETFNGTIVLGAADGSIYQFESNVLKKMLKGHSKACTAMHINKAKTLMVTGGSDGHVRIWNTAFDCVHEWAVDSMFPSPIHNTHVTSVCFDRESSHLIIATRNSIIFEVAISDGKAVGGVSIIDGHGCRQLWGLAVHPTKDEFVTSGDDSTIRIWNAKSFKQTKFTHIDTGSRAIAYSPDGKLLAVGFGSGKRFKGKPHLKEGSFAIMKSGDLKIIHEGKDCNQSVRCVRFSPDGKLLAMGCEDNNIYIYNVKDQYSKKSVIRSHQAPVLHIDFSFDGSYIMSADVAKRIKYFDASSGLNIPSSESLRDVKWSTINNVFNWNTLGLWLVQPTTDTSNRTTKIEPCVSQKSFGGQLMAAGNTAGYLFISHFPMASKQGFLTAFAHTGPIAQCAWLAGDGTIITIGKKDHTIMQWRCVYDNTREILMHESTEENVPTLPHVDAHHSMPGKTIAPPAPAHGTSGKVAHSMKDDKVHVNVKVDGPTTNVPSTVSEIGGGSMDVDSDIEEDGGYDPKSQIGKKKPKSPPSTVLEAESKESGEEVRRQWKSMICPPSNLQNENLSAPLTQGNVKFVSGSRLLDCRNTTLYNADGHLVFISSAIGVIFNRFDVTQIHYTGHQNQLISISLNQSRLLAATGDKGVNPEIHVWDARTAKGVYVLPSAHSGGVAGLCFSRDGGSLISLGQDEFHSVTVFLSPSQTWTDAFPLFSSSVSQSKMLWCIATDSNEYPYCVGGVGGIYYFRAINGAGERIRGEFGKSNRMQPITCATEGEPMKHNDMERTLVTGTLSGYIYVWYKHKVHTKISAHDSPIYTITKTNDHYISSGKDGQIKLWNYDLQSTYVFKLQSFLPRPFIPYCHAVSSDIAGKSIIVGMKSGETYEITLDTKSKSILLQNHANGELHGLAQNPMNSDLYATGGDDGWLKIWSLSKNYCLIQAYLECAIRVVIWSPDGNHIIAGIGGVPEIATKDGAFIVLDSKSLEIIREERKSKKYITYIKYSPNERLIAFACAEGRVYLHSPDFLFKKYIEIPSNLKLPCVVMKLDFDEKSNFMRMYTNYNELLYYRLDLNEFVSNPVVVKDVNWVTHTCPYSWNTQGIYQEALGMKILSSCIHPNGEVMATSYDNGEIRLYRYPCTNDKAKFTRLPGIGSQSHNIQFSADGKYLLALDTKLRIVIQYHIE